tara:strand:- start:35 stop:493 length:459 start_codon:yes stop_codon:yes gene_type:complete
MKKFTNILGRIAGAYFVYSVILHFTNLGSIFSLGDFSLQGAGVLKAFVFLTANTFADGNLLYFPLSLVVFTILIKLKKSHEIRFTTNNLLTNNLFIEGYFIVVNIGIISVVMKTSANLPSENIGLLIHLLFFNPLIYSLICYNLTISLLNKK